MPATTTYTYIIYLGRNYNRLVPKDLQRIDQVQLGEAETYRYPGLWIRFRQAIVSFCWLSSILESRDRNRSKLVPLFNEESDQSSFTVLSGWGAASTSWIYLWQYYATQNFGWDRSCL